ncbi:MAG: EVE domain-containing protein [Gemmatimonadaceae bacterium]|nr:EVE domain-containing protein [Gemmatimonadaceae bacterium]
MATTPRARRYWLVKSEPDAFSFDDLLASPRGTTRWDGVRNYQARNLLRDEMKRGDLAFFYHSSTDPAAIVGIAEVVREGYPDPTAFDASDPHFDPKSRIEAPAWIAVHLKAVEAVTPPITLAELRGVPALAGMTLLQRGSRLSVQPVKAAEWKAIRAMRPRRRA